MTKKIANAAKQSKKNKIPKITLADNAAVNSLVVTIGDRRIVGSVREKKQAEAQYQNEKQTGQIASLVKQHRPSLFCSQFANIPPGVEDMEGKTLEKIKAATGG